MTTKSNFFISSNLKTYIIALRVRFNFVLMKGNYFHYRTDFRLLLRYALTSKLLAFANAISALGSYLMSNKEMLASVRKNLSGTSPRVSIIIPTFNEQHTITRTLEALGKLRGSFEVVVVDGTSDDETLAIVERRAASGEVNNSLRVITSERGRGAQMHAGACAARGQVLWFIHADTLPPRDGVERIGEALRDSSVVGGNFQIRFDGDLRAARFLTWLYPQLRRIGLCYGDSAIFVRSDVYQIIDGFKPLPLFEDLDLVRSMRRRGRVVLIPATVVTSSRRFERRSFSWTFARWSLFQVLYWLGVSPHFLGRRYAPVRGNARANDK